MMEELLQAAAGVKKDKSLRAVIITGAASFCSGIDLGDLSLPKNQAVALWELIKPRQSLFQRACLVWREVPVPVIAAIDGHCLGAGLQLALACDVRISAPSASFAVMEAKWGLVPDMGITQAALGVVRADVLKELAMSARMIDGRAAYTLGLVTHMDDAPLTKAAALADEFATRSPDAVLAAKRVVNKMYEQSSGTLYREKLWQIKLMLGRNQKRAVKKAKDSSGAFLPRQFK